MKRFSLLFLIFSYVLILISHACASEPNQTRGTFEKNSFLLPYCGLPWQPINKSQFNSKQESLINNIIPLVLYNRNSQASSGNPLVAFLISCLDSKYSWIRDIASGILVAMGDQAVEPLSDVLSNSSNTYNSVQRQQAAQILGQIATPQAVEMLINALGGIDPDVNTAVSNALVQIGDQAIGPLSAVLNNPENSLSLRQEVIGLLVQIGGPKAAAVLIYSLSDENESIHSALLNGLVQIGTPAVAPLSEILNNPANNARMREDAAWVLGRIGGLEVTEALINTALYDKDTRIRLMAVYALGHIDSSEVVKALITAAGDENSMVSSAAVFSLGQIRSPDAIQALVSIVLNADKYNSFTRAEAAYHIGQSGDAAVVPSLVVVLGDENEDIRVRSAVAEALIQIGAPAVAPLSEILNNLANSESMRQSAAWALGIIGGPEAAQALIAALYDQSATVHSAAIDALFQIGEEATEPLKAAFVDSRPLVRQGARQVLLARLGNDAFRDYLEGRISDPNTNSVDRQYLEESLTSLDEGSRIINLIEQTYHITVDDRFDVTQLQSIWTILQIYPADELQGLDSIDFFPEMGFLYAGTYTSRRDEHNDSGNTSIQLMVFGSDETFQVLFHELGHFFDDKYFGFRAFTQLYNQNGPSEDFTREYGRLNANEDFSITYEAYCIDSRSAFLLAIDRAQAENSVYLQKLLFALDFTTRGHPDYAIIYRLEGNTVVQMQLSVTRDNNDRITHIQGLSTNDLEGLEDMFFSLDF